jgi:hypothetical protein
MVCAATMAQPITFAKERGAAPCVRPAEPSQRRAGRQAVELYGLRGITHGWGRLINVMSPDGAQAVLAHIETGEAFMVIATPGAPLQFHQAKGGSIDELVRRYGIRELDLATWERKKSELGDAALVNS